MIDTAGEKKYNFTICMNLAGKEWKSALNTEYLRYALEVEKTGSFTEAAVNLYVEQASLNQAVKSLEVTSGAPIFKRTPKGVVPTQQGRVFLKYAQNIISQIDEMEALCRPKDRQKIEFSLSIPRATYISEAFSWFVRGLDRSKGVELWVRETSAMETIEDVSEGRGKLGIIRYPLEFEKYYSQVLKENGLEDKLIWKYEPLVLMSENHPLAIREEVLYEDLTEYTEILHGDINLSTAFSDFNGYTGTQNRIYVFERASQISLLQTNMDTYMWVSPMPERILDQNGLIMKRCTDMKRRYRDVLICQKAYEMTAYDNAFFNEVCSLRDEMLM